MIRGILRIIIRIVGSWDYFGQLLISRGIEKRKGEERKDRKEGKERNEKKEGKREKRETRDKRKNDKREKRVKTNT